jgi:hypothetical protein
MLYSPQTEKANPAKAGDAKLWVLLLFIRNDCQAAETDN